jgi:hypothetical protein
MSKTVKQILNKFRKDGKLPSVKEMMKAIDMTDLRVVDTQVEKNLSCEPRSFNHFKTTPYKKWKSKKKSTENKEKNE